MTRRHWQSLILAFSISVGFVVFATLRIHHSEQGKGNILSIYIDSMHIK